MKILQIVPSISLIYGGPSQMVLGLAPALVQTGVEVTILTTDSNGDRGQAPLDVPLNQPIEQDGYKIIYFRCSPFRRYKFSLYLLQWLDNHGDEYDIVHIHALFSPVSSFAAWVCRRKNIPYILRPLGTLDPADLRKKKRLKQIYAAAIEKANIAQAAGIHFTSVEEAKISHRFGVTTRDIILPLGVNPGVCVGENSIRVDFGIGEDLPIVLFMSRIDPKKGLEILIPALENLIQAGIKFHFIMAGTNPQDPEYEQKIQTRIHTSSLRSHSTITGFVTGTQKSALLQAADLFVLPSYYENFGIAVAEAMVAGVPVVISDGVHIWSDVRNCNGGWVCHNDIQELTQQLSLALTNPQERQERGRNAREYALNHYSWSAIAQQLIQVYSDLISHNSRNTGNR
ncbi:hormogonium polysaccharide biosynthesis glycosyltransferase HpsP [Calothrix sp. NIES-3974]|uniref:hormogonium polysaccharide biosynthesis glycosyltransferase HpsP n=1 Tax=Calothrix sp. NIES-3974 TaxID=2005462 RepID=UPI000B60D910|nr:hormogonium polysaccharide biosynthesis glycosyltransferase HpsP [Calothrix sp. NIES-3974]BAZ08131.1 group 1 glycosyl transferase [Calothrix sp. NIES-3974]